MSRTKQPKEVVSPELSLIRGSGCYFNSRLPWICVEGLYRRFEKHSLGNKIRVHVVKRRSKHTITIDLDCDCRFSDARTHGRREGLHISFHDFLRLANLDLGKPMYGPTHFWIEVIEEQGK